MVQRNPAVSYQYAKEMKDWNPAIDLVTIAGADHVFGGKHPWHEEGLSADMEVVVSAAIAHIK